MDSKTTDPSLAVKPSFQEKHKKSLFYALAIGSASLAFFVPFLASASFLSLSAFFQNTASANASTPQHNSQTVPLLTPVTNIDPKPSVGGGDIALVAGSALLPQNGPAGTSADLASLRPSSSAISVYTVHAGDTLSGIAHMFDVSVNTIMWANDLKNGTIREGQVLVILPITGVRYEVKEGDTLASIAKKYNADVKEVARYNDLPNNATLAAGNTVIIPDGEIAPAPAPARTTARSSGSTAPLRGASGPNISGYWAWPLAGGVLTQGLHGYNGVDIGAPSGTDIYASAAGTVLIANGGGGWNGGYGNYVVIQHDNGTQTLYAHASRVLVSSGQRVGQGAVIALVGATGKSTGAHLHFEIRGAVNPFGR